MHNIIEQKIAENFNNEKNTNLNIVQKLEHIDSNKIVDPVLREQKLQQLDKDKMLRQFEKVQNLLGVNTNIMLAI